MNPTLIINIVLFVAAAYFATKAYWWIEPYVWGRRDGESMLEHVTRVAREQQQYQAKQLGLNMPRWDALRVRTANVAILLASLYLAQYLKEPSTNVFILAYGVYVIAGYIACKVAGVVPAAAMEGLGWTSRMTVRLYYVWLWPINVGKALTRKHRRLDQP